jgi:hypothetical protein
MAQLLVALIVFVACAVEAQPFFEGLIVSKPTFDCVPKG